MPATSQFLAFFFSVGVWGLKMVRLKVPAATDIFRPVTLTCEYDLEGGNLYSVKWYKDEREFFRYTPGYEPHNQAFHTPGISLDVSNLMSDCVNCV